MKKVLLTGCAGFIGFHVATRLLAAGHEVFGIDNLSRFYDDGLKKGRLEMLRNQSRFEFAEVEIADQAAVGRVFSRGRFDWLVHLAAQAGVRYSLENPHLYVQSNIVGFVNLAEEARKQPPQHFVFASSSSVYGENRKIPFSETDNVDFPISLYAATKKSDELIAHVYAHLYRLPITGLRFFTVYGPWGRPDMAIFKFCKAIYDGTPIELYNYGRMRRDFTYIDDVVEGTVRLLEKPPAAAAANINASASPCYRIFNIGNNRPVELGQVIAALEKHTGKKAIVKPVEMQPGDVPVTYADIDALSREVGYTPKTSIEDGIGRFVEWYRSHYRV